MEEAEELRKILHGIEMINKAGQTPDEWSRYRIWLDLQNIARRVEYCGVMGIKTHKNAVEWCNKVASVAERGAWQELAALMSDADRHFREIDGCTSNPIKY